MEFKMGPLILIVYIVVLIGVVAVGGIHAYFSNLSQWRYMWFYKEKEYFFRHHYAPQ